MCLCVCVCVIFFVEISLAYLVIDLVFLVWVLLFSLLLLHLLLSSSLTRQLGLVFFSLSFLKAPYTNIILWLVLYKVKRKRVEKERVEELYSVAYGLSGFLVVYVYIYVGFIFFSGLKFVWRNQVLVLLLSIEVGGIVCV